MTKKPMFILMVDDDADDRQFFREALFEIDPKINCALACDGIEGLEFLMNTTELPDFVFLDLNMPRMGGKQFLSEIRRHDKFSKLPVIVYSTSRLEEDEAEVLRLGAVGYIQKPAGFDEICMALSDILARIPG